LTDAQPDEIPTPRPLVKKPLVEVVFELRWKLSEGPLAKDPGFRIFVGRYYDRVRSQYPDIVDLPSSQIPEEMTAHVVRHQFWTGKGQWPLTQIGPGILTVNETDGYLWESFRPRLVHAVRCLAESYPQDIHKLTPTQVSLKYIDAVPFDPTQSSTTLLQFMREALHTGIDVEPRLFDTPEQSSSPLASILRRHGARKNRKVQCSLPLPTA
jgi:uncharacterized protein (TIGR04255 family)